MTAPISNAFARSATSRLASAFMSGARTGAHEPQLLFAHQGVERLAATFGWGASNVAQSYADTKMKGAANDYVFKRSASLWGGGGSQ